MAKNIFHGSPISPRKLRRFLFRCLACASDSLLAFFLSLLLLVFCPRAFSRRFPFELFKEKRYERFTQKIFPGRSCFRRGHFQLERQRRSAGSPIQWREKKAFAARPL